jgi:hypothetical protein
MSEEKKQCPVCYEDLTLENVVNLPCNHSQCSSCFWKWTNEQGKQSCCMCRSDYLTHKNHQLSSDVEEANSALEWARRSLAECLRREDQIKDTIDDLYEQEELKKNDIQGLENIYEHKEKELEKLDELVFYRIRDCYNLGCSLPMEGCKMSDDMLSLFYERRHKKRLDIAQKKRDGRYKKVLEELRRHHYHLTLIDNDFKKIVLLGNQLKLVKFVNSLTEPEVNIGESAWMFEEDEMNYGFWVTQAQTTMKPVYADIKVYEARIECKVKNYEKYWCWEKGEYERKIVNWKTPEDYRKASVWSSVEFTHFKKWHKRLVKALRLTRDVKTEKGHRKRNIDVEENRMRKIFNERTWYKINKVDDLGEYCIRMFNEPPEFRPELEEGEIDEMYESEYGIDVEEEYNTSTVGSTGGTSDTDSSMPELVEMSEDDELEYERPENIEGTYMRLWRELRSGNLTDQDVEHHVNRLAEISETFILQE